MNKGNIIKEISKEELEKNLKKRIEIEVNNVNKCTQYLEENKISYEIISDNKINIYDTVNITKLINELSKNDCIVNDLHEREDSLENYYINLMGGNDNV